MLALCWAVKDQSFTDCTHGDHNQLDDSYLFKNHTHKFFKSSILYWTPHMPCPVDIVLYPCAKTTSCCTAAFKDLVIVAQISSTNNICFGIRTTTASFEVTHEWEFHKPNSRTKCRSDTTGAVFTQFQLWNSMWVSMIASANIAMSQGTNNKKIKTY